MREEAVLFGETKSLVGILTDPPMRNGNHPNPAVILLNPGIVHRVAPGRIYVRMARALAAMGFVVLRFDFSGIGDSAVRYDNLPFDKSAVRETQDAMHFLEATRGVGRFILLGGCSGARISLHTACRDPRVVGAFLINLQMNEDEDQNSDQATRSAAFYYWNFALFNLKSWSKLLTGKADYRNILRAVGFQARTQFASGGKVSAESIQLAANLRMLAERGASVTFLYAESDPRLNDLREAVGRELKQLRALGNVRVQIIPRSDHTFSSLHDQEKLLKEICELIDAVTPASAGAPLNQRHDQLPQSVQKTLPQYGGK
jgi:pimeloyl-ACP methyl ester carboxylesterase